MDLSLIISAVSGALGAGASSALTDATNAAIADAYQGFKSLIIKKSHAMRNELSPIVNQGKKICLFDGKEATSFQQGVNPTRLWAGSADLVFATPVENLLL